MTPESQQIAIAEACGWTEILRPCHEAYHDLPTDTLGLVMGRVCGIRPGGIHIENAAPLPDYLTDLNAMHEAEQVLDYNQLREMEDSVSFQFAVYPFHATAAQRAEAFLRTIGKWEDWK
jgi:hypothetical protein